MVKGDNEKIPEKLAGGTDTQSEGEGKGNSSPEDTDTKRKRGGSETDTKRKRGGSETEGQGIPRLVVIDEPSGEMKPKKRKKGKQEDPVSDPGLVSMVNLLTVSIFELTASKAGEIWRITPEEANAISTPLASIIGKAGGGEIAEKYGDYIALTIALGVVCVPRVIMTQQVKKRGENVEQKRQIEGDNKPVDKSTSPSGVGDVKSILPGLA